MNRKANKPSRKDKWRNAIREVHLWLGLASGIVVLIVSITGCLFAFQEEISEALYKKQYFVQAQDKATLPLSTLTTEAQKALGAAHPIGFITAYKAPGRAWEFMSYKENDTAFTYFGNVEYYRSAFVNPYTGEITGIRDYKYDFFSIVKYLHWSLLLNTKYGQPIVGWSTLIFVVLLITGLVLWWPRRWNKATRRQSFAIKWKARFKRLNYDLHNVLGFYALLLALVLGLTGMVWSFTWFQSAAYAAAAGTTQPPQHKEVKSAHTTAPPPAKPIDLAYAQAVAQLPDYKRLGISPADGKEGVIYCYGYRGTETYYNFDELQFDQYSGKLLNRINEKDRNNGERLLNMNYDIHVGAIGGITGKIIAFLISLVCASLPVTGFLVWWGKRHKKSLQKPPVRRMVAQPVLQ